LVLGDSRRSIAGIAIAMDYRKFQTQRFWWHLVSAPIVWLPLPAIIALDILGELYHQICFSIYGIAKVKRSAYIQIIDQNKLQYLNPLEKLGCMYCGYANGVLLYLKEIAGRTEKYWCGIKHQDKPGFKAQGYQTEGDFVPYGDEAQFKEKYPLK